MNYVITKKQTSILYRSSLTPHKKYDIIKKLSMLEWEEIEYDYNPKEYKFDIIIIDDDGSKSVFPNNVFYSTEELRTFKISKLIDKKITI